MREDGYRRFYRIANAYIHSSRIANPAERRLGGGQPSSTEKIIQSPKAGPTGELPANSARNRFVSFCHPGGCRLAGKSTDFWKIVSAFRKIVSAYFPKVSAFRTKVSRCRWKMASRHFLFLEKIWHFARLFVPLHHFKPSSSPICGYHVASGSERSTTA